MMPVISFWSKGQVPVDLIFLFTIYILNLPINQVCQWMVLVYNTSLAIDSDK